MTIVDILSALFPLIAIAIIFGTPKGCGRTINQLVAVMIIFIFGLEEFILSDFAVSLGVVDGSWHDATLFSLYALMMPLFYRTGGSIQLALSGVGALLSAWYWTTWSGNSAPINLFYAESFIALTIMQLLVASDLALKPLLNKMLHGGDIESPGRTPNHASSGRSIHRNHP